jgi:hypothetical protein
MIPTISVATPTASAQSVGFHWPGVALVAEALERAVHVPLMGNPEGRDQRRPHAPDDDARFSRRTRAEYRRVAVSSSFVRVVRAIRGSSSDTRCSPFVSISVGTRITSFRARKASRAGAQVPSGRLRNLDAG